MNLIQHSLYSSSVKDGKWENDKRLPLLNGTSTAILLSKLTKNGNTYSYTFTADVDYESLYFTFRNNGKISFDSIKVKVN